MAKLLINEGGQASVFELFEDEASIGRGASNAIQVGDAHASKNHAVIRRIGGRLKLVDLESKNGTRVNGEFRNQRWLTHGDAISIGAAVLTYDGSGDAPAAPSRPAAGRVSVGGALAAPLAAPASPSGALDARPAASARPAGRSGAGRPGARRGRDEDDEDGEPRRRSPPKKSGAPMGLLVGAGVLGFMAILFLLLSRSGAGKNAMALREAKNLYAGGHVQAALDHLAAYADPSDVDGYKSVQSQIDTWRAQQADAAESAKEDEANKEYNKLYRQFVEWWKTGRPQDEFGEVVLAYVTQYEGTLKVKEIMHADGDPYPKLRALLQKAKDKKNQGK